MKRRDFFKVLISGVAAVSVPFVAFGKQESKKLGLIRIYRIELIDNHSVLITGIDENYDVISERHRI